MTLMKPGYFPNTAFPEDILPTNNQYIPMYIKGGAKNTRQTQNVHSGVMFQVHGSVGF